MKKNLLVSLTLSSLTIFSLLPLTAKANSEIRNRAEVEFKANSETVDPVDPDDGKTINPNKPPTKGPLSLNYASNVMFDKHKKTSKEQTFYAKADTITVSETDERKEVANFVQVTDLRGTATGWRLSVRQNGPLKKENGVAIVGGKLTVSARSIKSAYGFTNIPSKLSTNQVLSEDGQTHEIVVAEPGTGVSTWSIFLGDEEQTKSGISLTVPQGSVKETGVYSTSLTWFLQDVL